MLSQDLNHRNTYLSGSTITLPAASLLCNGRRVDVSLSLKLFTDVTADVFRKHKGDLHIQTKTITPHAAKCLAARKRNKNADWTLSLALEKIDGATAEALAQSDYAIHLDTGGVLPDEVGEALANHKGDGLSLGCGAISAFVAEKLSKYKSDLDLFDLKYLSEDAAKCLACHQSNLGLPTEIKISDIALNYFEKKKGTINWDHPSIWITEQAIKNLKVNGKDELPCELIPLIRSYRGDALPDLRFLRTITADSAEAIAKAFDREINLEGISELNPEAAEHLISSGADLLLGVSNLSIECAEILSKHQGYLSFSGLTELSDAAAQSLSNHRGNLNLDLDVEISEKGLAYLKKYRGNINLEPAKDWVDHYQYLKIERRLRDSILHRYSTCPNQKRSQFLDNFFRDQEKQGIIFSLEKKKAEMIHAELAKLGHSLEIFHSNLRKPERKKVIDAFMNNSTRFIVISEEASQPKKVRELQTVISNIKNSNVDFIIHLEVPDNYSYRKHCDLMVSADRKRQSLILANPNIPWKKGIKSLGRELGVRFEQYQPSSK